MSADIRKSTMNVCMGWQASAAHYALRAATYLDAARDCPTDPYFAEMAVLMQRDAAFAHEQVAVRLDQLV